MEDHRKQRDDADQCRRASLLEEEGYSRRAALFQTRVYAFITTHLIKVLEAELTRNLKRSLKQPRGSKGSHLSLKI